MKKRNISFKYTSFLALLFVIPGFCYGQSDLFEIRTPNAMIIFDTSSSMNMDVNGIAASSGNAEGVDKVIRNYEGGGNHPNSKLFQAKQALKEVIKDLENINLGLATYGQVKTEVSRGYYWRNRKDYTTPVPDRWRWTKLYWKFNKYGHSYNKTEFSPDSFTDAWGATHSGVTVGYTFSRTHTFDNSPDNNSQSVPPPHPPGTYVNTLTFTVTSIVYNPEYNWYTYHYSLNSHDHYEETTISKDYSNSDPIDCDLEFPKNWSSGGWKTYSSIDPEQIANPGKWACKGPNKISGTLGGFGAEYKEYAWLQLIGKGCPTPYGNAQNISLNPGQHYWTEWALVPPNTLATTHPVNITQTNCYDFSSYTYPSDGTSNKPHTWSYFKMDGGGNWPSNIQPNPYYPALDGNPGENDNHFFFINFPEVDDDINSYAVRNSIVDLLDLIPEQSPETGRWHTKLPLKGGWHTLPSGKMSVTSNTSDSPTRQTPLADSLLAAKKYFDDYINKYKGGDAASKSNCRGNYVILLTDGLESCRFLNPPSNTQVDYDAAVTASAGLLGLGVKTFVIGFGRDLKGNDTLERMASSGGTGKAYFASNLDELKKAFKMIFQAIGGFYARSNPVVTVNRDKIYRAYFSLPGWEGHLIAYGVDGQGKVGAKVWDAGEVMAPPSGKRGDVYTWDKDKNPVAFSFVDPSAGTLKDLLNSPEEDINEDGNKDTNDSKTIINFVLDASYGEYEISNPNPPPDKIKIYPYRGKRSPQWKLGDIYHSTPMVLGKPPFNFPDSLFPKKYSEFKNANDKRPTLIYVGANDGMLHAINDSDGTERFAIIPKNLLGKLKEIRKEHYFFVDSSPRTFDVYFKKKNEWGTVIVSGQRGGGNYYFAVDVTDPSKKPVEILWELTDPGMGNTWSRPVMGIVKISGQYKFVAFVGGGYSPSNNVGNTFYVIDIEDGSILRKFVVGDTANKVPAGATAFDRNSDGLVDAVYFGDMQGVLWKIKIEKEENIDKWDLIKLFEPAEKNPIFYPPAVTKNNQGKVLVYFGQGNELNIFEKDKYYYFFEIWDNDSTGVKNWEIKFDNKGEKVLAAPSVANNFVYFTTWEYTGIELDCGAGKGRLYGLTTTRQGVLGGADALYLDPVTGNELGTPKKYFDLGKGIPSAPIVTNGMIYISRSVGKTEDEIKPEGKHIRKWSKGKLKYWREIMN